MKKILFILLFTLFFIACDDKKDEQNMENRSTLKKEVLKINPQITITSNETKIEKENPFISYDIDGNRVVKISPDGEETPLTKELGALISIRNSYEKLNAKILSQRLSKNYMQKCSACHDNYANGVIGPSLLDKNEDEIFNIINAYKTKEKVNILMKDLVAKMPESEIRELAKEIANLNKEVREKE